MSAPLDAVMRSTGSSSLLLYCKIIRTNVLRYGVNHKCEGRRFSRKEEETNNLNGTSMRWGTNNFSATQDISPLLQNLRV